MLVWSDPVVVCPEMAQALIGGEKNIKFFFLHGYTQITAMIHADEYQTDDELVSCIVIDRQYSPHPLPHSGKG